jgi:hypothetical protein
MPPTLMGSEAEQLVQIHRYLFRMNDMLNQAMESQTVTVQDIVTQQQEKNVSVEKLDTELLSQYNRAKALIIKTAGEVRAEMDQIETTLKSEYTALSKDWGSYQETIDTKITATAKDVVQEYKFQSQIDANGTAFKEYVAKTEGHIQSGIIGTDDDGFPIIGIAIGQEVKSTVIDGQVHIDTSKNLATYTSDRITFWQNGEEAAHISSGEMVIYNVHIRGKLQLGDNWEISHTKGFTIKWIGGDGQ